MKLKVFQKGFNYSQDGPGNRLVIHFQGCNMHCPWCSNPEGIRIDAPANYTLSVEELLDECLRSRPMFFGGGGVTLTGGEVCVQLDAALLLLAGLKSGGVNTCIETNAAHPRLEELFPHLDLLIADLKHVDAQIHQAFTGLDCAGVQRNLAKAAACSLPLWVRIPMIGGFNADAAFIPGFISFFEELKAIGADLSVEILPYHEYGKSKWEQLGLTYAVENAHVDIAVLREFETAFQSAGIRVIHT